MGNRWLRDLSPMLILRNVIAVLLLTLFALEVLLRAIDPIGVVAYTRFNAWAHTHRLPDATGYIHTPGTYRVNGQAVTIGADGLRITPDSDATCTVAVLGDSVLFGFGVSDDDTFVSQLATRYPDVRWINTGRTGYNVDNFHRVLDTRTADGWLYYAVSNDASDPPATTAQVRRTYSATALHARLVYAFTRTRQASPRAIDWQPFDELITRLQSRDALMIGADDHAVTARLVVHGGASIPAHRHPISAVDPHPNPAGHMHIADALTPLVDHWLPTVCDLK